MNESLVNNINTETTEKEINNFKKTQNFDRQKYSDQKNFQNNIRNPRFDTKCEIECFQCGRRGHKKADCWQLRSGPIRPDYKTQSHQQPRNTFFRQNNHGNNNYNNAFYQGNRNRDFMDRNQFQQNNSQIRQNRNFAAQNRENFQQARNNVGNNSVCFFCNKVGHVWKKCFTLQNLQQSGKISQNWSPNSKSLNNIVVEHASHDRFND